MNKVLWTRGVGVFRMAVLKKPDGSIQLDSYMGRGLLTSRNVPTHIASTLPVDSAAWSVITDCQLAIHRMSKTLEGVRP